MGYMEPEKFIINKLRPPGKRPNSRMLPALHLFFLAVTALCAACANTASYDDAAKLTYKLDLDTLTRGENEHYMWTHARSAAIPGNPPEVITTMSMTLKSGSDVYHDLYQAVTRDMGETWSKPEAIPSLKVRQMTGGYRSMADMWPKWHSASKTILNIGTSPFYANDRTHDGSKKEVTYAVYNPRTAKWSEARKLSLPDRDHDGRLLMAPAAGSAQWLELPGGDVLLPIFYFKITDDQATEADEETFTVENLMKRNDLGFATIIARCAFDGTTLTYKEHGDEITLRQGRGLYEPSLAYFREQFFLTMRSDKSAYIAKGSDGLHFGPASEWKFDNDSILGSYNTQQHWVTHRDGLFLVYTRKGANNDHVFRHRAPLFMAQVDPQNLRVIRSSERIVVPERGAALGNFGVSNINESETWITVAEYMRREKNVKADNSVFVARIQWNKPNSKALK